MFGGIGFQEILIIVVVGLLVFGATRLPKIAKSLGQGIKEFKKSIKDSDTDEDEENRIRYVDQGQYNQPQQFGQYQSQQYNPQASGAWGGPEAQYQGPAPAYGPNQQQGQYPPQDQGYAQNQPQAGSSTSDQQQKADNPEENQKSS
jgi:sec-independent protein translocase protein TatA